MSKRRRAHPLERPGVPAYHRLMHAISGMGFCGSVVHGEPRHVDMYIPERGSVTADQFAEWVLLAEGLDPVGSSCGDETRKAFVEHMGSEVVDAQMLKWQV